MSTNERWRYRLSLLIIIVLLLLNIPATTAQSHYTTTSHPTPLAPQTSCKVTNTNDSGAGSLRDKVADPTCDYITFSNSLAQQTITLTSQISITRSLTIDGGTLDVRISGNNTTRMFLVGQNTVNFYRLTLKQGNASNDGGGAMTLWSSATVTISQTNILDNYANFSGGAISSIGPANKLVINQSTISNNRTNGSGGAIENSGCSELVIINSTISNNRASYGGGIASIATLQIHQSTISGNQATNKGGGVYSGDNSLIVNRSTLSNNVSNMGGGIYIDGTATSKNSIIAGNQAPSGKDLFKDPTGIITSTGYNLIGSNHTVEAEFPLPTFAVGPNPNVVEGQTASFTVTLTPNIQNDLVGTPQKLLDPKLGPLQDNGGLTWTMLPLADSPAINNGPTSLTIQPQPTATPAVARPSCGNTTNEPVFTTDQRGDGYPRLVGPRIDIGAVETTSTLPATSPTTTMRYTTSDHNAITGVDYIGQSGILTFTAGITQTVITVPTIDDSLDEIAENFKLELSNPVNATISRSFAVATILDNDPNPIIRISDASVIEGDTTPTTMTFKVTLDAVSGATVYAKYKTTNGSAIYPDDYQSTGSFIPIPAGQTTGYIHIPINGDLLAEGDETFTITLYSVAGATTVNGGVAIGTIIDNDTPPSLSIADSSVLEPQNGTVTMPFTVSLNYSNNYTVTVNYTTADVTALARFDYVGANGTLTFLPGQTEKVILITINADSLLESSETFNLLLSNPVNAIISNNSANGTILQRTMLVFLPFIMK